MLRRIIALLVSLAVLAERAAERSLPVRWLVLWILRRAETVLEDFVFDETGLPPPAMQGSALAGNGPDDALCLAARFKAFAAVLAALLPLPCMFGHWPGRRAVPGHFASDSRCAVRWTPKPNDTS
jgi:hypothetical protein